MSQRQIGYCTNVHAGPDLGQTRANLERYAEEVKRRYSPQQPMGVGLWLAAPAARQLCASPNELREFADYLREAGLVPFTLNGFPYGDFHREVVKHDVYLPTWMAPARLEYTRDLAQVLDAILPAQLEGTISTLPIGWGAHRDDFEGLQQAGRQLAALANELADRESKTGRCLSVCLEPEPGCVMDRAEHIVEFFEQHLLPMGREAAIRRHVRVCHDVCHSAVMFEPQEEALRRYRDAGVQVGKVQVSSAVALPLSELGPADRDAALAQLAAFNEPRYLHQTVHRDEAGHERFFEDLAPALAALSNVSDGEIRVHFHVPIYLESFSALRTTREQVLECLREVECDHFEVETYAWNVLPQELRHESLAAGIAEELSWFRDQLAS